MQHKIAVKRRGTTLWKCELCATPREKRRGLMFRSKAVPLLFEFDSEARSANAIHSFFCPRFDAVFLDGSRRAVDIRENLAPWNPWIAPKKPAKYLLELPAGEAQKKRVKAGEKLDFKVRK